MAAPAQAHHLMELTHLAPSPLTGFLSGLAHPILGPDHLLFLCALSLVGLKRRAPWMLALLATGLLGSVVGLVRPGLPFAEAAVAFSLVVVGLLWLKPWPKTLLLPAIALHGYVLSDTVLGIPQPDSLQQRDRMHLEHHEHAVPKRGKQRKADLHEFEQLWLRVSAS
jgi:urease accessory protein